MEKENKPSWKNCADSLDERQKYTKIQTNKLEKEFANNNYPTRDEFKTLSKSMKISERRIQVWFQNRRARQRRVDRKASGIPENPLPNMFFRLSANAGNRNLLALRKSNQENIPPTMSEPKKQKTGSYRKTSTSRMQKSTGSRRTSSNSNVHSTLQRRSVRGMSDVNEDNLASLMQHIDWETTEFDDNVFTDELDIYL